MNGQTQSDYLKKSLIIRPRIYIYELPPKLTSSFLYHHHPHQYNSIYMAGRFLHARLLASEFRTADATEADFFFVPIWGRAAAFGPPRQRSKYILQTYEYVRQMWPYWDLNNGTDHLWVITDDHGACDEFNDMKMVKSIENSIFITHFGYTGGRRAYGHPTNAGCFREGHDVVIPPPIPARPEFAITANALRYSDRPTLFFFGGDARMKGSEMYEWGGRNGMDGVPVYSHGVRQLVVQSLSNEPNFTVWAGHQKTYEQDISRAQFCLAPTGAGWGIRVVEEVTRGCIPVIIQDNVTQAFEEILPYAKFSVRVSEADIPRLPEILRNITQSQVQQMRKELSCVWKRLTWSSVYGQIEDEDETQTLLSDGSVVSCRMLLPY